MIILTECAVCVFVLIWLLLLFQMFFFFFFKQKTAYEMRISDWSSDVCSSDLRIPLQDSPLELRYYERANWTDVAPRMLQSLIVQSFDNTGRIVGVGRETAGLGADFVLKTDLRAFQAEYPKPLRSEEHTSELQSLMRNSYAVFCLKKKKKCLKNNKHK